MSQWTLCDGDMYQEQIQSRANVQSRFLGGQKDWRLHKHTSKISLKSGKKESEVISLKRNKKITQNDRLYSPRAQAPRNHPRTHYSPKFQPLTSVISFRSQQKMVIPKFVQVKQEFMPSSQQFSQAYLLSPRPAKIDQRPPPIHTRVHINYVNTPTIPKIPVLNPESQNSPPLLAASDNKGVKRMNTMPSKINSNSSSSTFNNEPSGREELRLAKSLDYLEINQQDEALMERFKQSTNLNEMDCIKAESLPDSEEERDEISIVLSPFQIDADNNKQTFADRWNFLRSIENKELSTPETAEQEQIEGQ